MKKAYIRPTATQIELEPAQMLAASSIEYKLNDGQAGQWSQGMSSGSWSSDNWSGADE